MSVLIPFDFHADDRLDGLTIIKPFARGGNGDLYLVRNEDGHVQAMKVIRRTDNDNERSGWEQCLAVSAQIPGLVPILKTGMLPNGRFYCVMPPADNLAKWPDYEPDTLANRIRRDGLLPPDEVLDIAYSLALTVKALHDAGLAHCDIKPENILFVEGQPMLSDYSLLSDASGQVGEDAGSSGTAGFIPPEMIGNPSYYNPKVCDLYALGKIVYCAWSGMDEMSFPSLPQGFSLQEVGVMRPVYMGASSSTPSKRFKNIDEFISALADARSRLKNSSIGRRRIISGKFARILLLVALILALAVLVNAVFFLFFRTGDNPSAGQPVAADNPPVVTAPDNMPYRGDPLLVTTDRDVEDATDAVNSLREALRYAQQHGSDATVSFAGDYEIRLAFALPVSKNVILDGGENKITLIGPETDSMFRVTEATLTLKNMSLASDRAAEDEAGIAEVKKGGVKAVSVIDGGKAEWLWTLSEHSDLKLSEGSRLHRVRTNPPGSTSGSHVRIEADSILEDSVLAFKQSSTNEACEVYGQLKHTTISDGCVVYVFAGSTCENLTVRSWGLVIHQPGATINGIKLDFPSVYSYDLRTPELETVLTGTVSIGGVAMSFTNKKEARIAGKETDIVFDLTERTEKSWLFFSFNASRDGQIHIIYVPREGHPSKTLFYDSIKPFLGARSFTARVKADQPAGTYTLAINAQDFDLPVSLAVGDDIYPDALSVGKSFSVNGRTYSLSFENELINDAHPNDQYVVALRLNIAEQ